MTDPSVDSGQLSRWRKAVAALVIVLPLLVILMYFLRYLYIYEAFNFGVEKVAISLRLDENLARAVVAVGIAPFFYLLREAMSVFSSRRRNIGIAGLAAYFALYSVAAWSASRDVYFDEDGATRWYALRADGSCYFASKSGVDPRTGKTLRQVTSHIVEACDRNQGVGAAEYASVDLIPHFFNPATGEAEVWFSADGDNGTRFFDGPGFDPTTGKELTPIRREVIEEYLARMKEESTLSVVTMERAKAEALEAEQSIRRRKQSTAMRALVRPAVMSGTKRNAGIVLANLSSNNLQPDEYTRACSLALIGVAPAGVSVAGDILDPRFVSEGHFSRVLAGESSLLKQMGVFNATENLILGTMISSCKQSDFQDLISCNVELATRRFDGTGAVTSDTADTAVGAGFTEPEAAGRACEQIGRTKRFMMLVSGQG
jgi:hypothetical protein